jgi:[acyl-carrier-protein] S-malonyltransferase
MGRAWQDRPAWAVVERAEALLGEPLGRLLVDAPAEVLGSTRAAQLAVLLTSLVTWEAARDRSPAPAGHRWAR